MDNWRVLDFTTFKGLLRYQRGQLIARFEDENEKAVPLADVGTVLLGLQTATAPALLHELAAFDIITLICDWRGVPAAAMTAWIDHGRVGARHRAQYDMTIPRRKNAWGQIIRAKVAGQAANLKILGHRDAEHLAAMVKLVRSGDPQNVEGTAAGYYWRRLFQSKFSRQPQTDDNRNSMLDYGYAVLRGAGVRAVMSAGLAASLGVFHRGRGNAFNLVDDLIEPFRPAIDYVVAATPPEMSLAHPTVKHRLVAASTQVFQPNGSSVATCLTDLAQAFGRYAEGHGDHLAVPAWAGPRSVADEHEAA
ncbi:MAG: type II CRISPR-associated endonuclease Cas1 [Propionibacteriaceae bacterium]|jgi:CRISPR-associated protein Cas1|nr:type II CRISPR-associated endonuclease Cas1 [Propionibacteriaceae bacterium]